MGLVTLELKDGRQWGGRGCIFGDDDLDFRTQWRKVKQMQPMQLCTFSCRPIKGTFKNLKMHSGEKSNKCNQCDYASNDIGNLGKHLKMHRGEKSNKCSQCDFACSDPSSLRKHMKRHNPVQTGELSLFVIVSKTSEDSPKSITNLWELEFKLMK